MNLLIIGGILLFFSTTFKTGGKPRHDAVLLQYFHVSTAVLSRGYWSTHA